MRRLQPIDRLLLVTLLPLWMAAFTLHVGEIQRTGLAQVPVYASPTWHGERYPTVGGFRLERDTSGTGLEVGDRMLRIGDADLRGVGYFGFDAIAFDQAGEAGEAALELERDGVLRTIALALRPSATPWARVPFSLAYMLIALVVLLRAPATSATRFFFIGFTTFAIFETPFEGGPPLQTFAAYAIFHLLGPVSLYFLLRWFIRFPEEVPEQQRLSPRLAWIALVFPIARVSYWLGAPIPSHLVPNAVLLSDVALITTALAIISWNTIHADPLGRRRVKWVLFGAYLAGVPVLLNLVIESIFGVGFMRFDVLLDANIFMAIAVPLGILIAILRYRLFDIDRVISTAASYSLLAGLVVVGEETVVPPIAHALSGALGLEPASSEVPLSALVALAAIPAHQWLRPQIDRLFFSQRYDVETGMGELLTRMSGCADPESLTETVGAELYRLMQPVSCAIYACIGKDYEIVFAEGPPGPASCEGEGPLVGVIRGHVGALAPSGGARGVAPLDPFERAALETLGAEVVVPVKQRDRLVAFFCLGPKRSGDIYTPTDLALLAAAAEKFSAELVHLDREGGADAAAPAE